MISIFVVYFFFFKQKTAYEMRISDWSSDVCSSDLCSSFTIFATEPANGSPLAIPFAGGLLLGRFQAEPKIDNSGGHVTFNKYCMRNHTVFYPTPTNFVVRTYVNPKLLRPEQHEIVREMAAWLAAHQAEAEAAGMKSHRLEEIGRASCRERVCQSV